MSESVLKEIDTKTQKGIHLEAGKCHIGAYIDREANMMLFAFEDLNHHSMGPEVKLYVGSDGRPRLAVACPEGTASVDLFKAVKMLEKAAAAQPKQI